MTFLSYFKTHEKNSTSADSQRIFAKENFLLLFPAFLCKMKIWIFWNFAKIVIR